ncbi:hypothetical protein, partial [Pseudomonas viridiflava]|uniref:hypothetical protein n=1 Tax=Pseudomonas viridiflava TaxID=33069 RepID=UPI0019812D99
RDLKHADHAHACAPRYTRVLLRQRTVGGGLPAMNDDAIFLKHRIAGKPPPTRKNSASSVVYGSFDKR